MYHCISKTNSQRNSVNCLSLDLKISREKNLVGKKMLQTKIRFNEKMSARLDDIFQFSLGKINIFHIAPSIG